MLGNQRHLFDLPDDVAYFNCATSTPLLKHAAAAGQAGIARKLRPWTVGAEHTVDAVERARALVADIIDASPADMALVPSAAYGLSTAAAVLPLTRGQE